MAIFIGDNNGTPRNVKDIFIGDETGTPRKVINGYISDGNGTPRKFYSATRVIVNKDQIWSPGSHYFILPANYVPNSLIVDIVGGGGGCGGVQVYGQPGNSNVRFVCARFAGQGGSAGRILNSTAFAHLPAGTGFGITVGAAGANGAGVKNISAYNFTTGNGTAGGTSAVSTVSLTLTAMGGGGAGGIQSDGTSGWGGQGGVPSGKCGADGGLVLDNSARNVDGSGVQQIYNYYLYSDQDSVKSITSCHFGGGGLNGISRTGTNESNYTLNPISINPWGGVVRFRWQEYE